MSIRKLWYRFELIVLCFLIACVALLPVIEILWRNVFMQRVSIGAINVIPDITFLIAVLGISIAGRHNEHLQINLPIFKTDYAKLVQQYIVGFVVVLILVVMFISSLSFIVVGGDLQDIISFHVGMPGIPKIFFLFFLPISLGLTCAHYIHRMPKTIVSIGLICGAFICALFFSLGSISNLLDAYLFGQEIYEGVANDLVFTLNDIVYAIPQWLFSSFLILIIISVFFGTPLFITMGGTALLLFVRNGEPLDTVFVEGYSLLKAHEVPPIILFTFAGYLLSDSKAGERLINLFQALFSFLPGGVAFAAIIVSAFFTTFTGASGITILALGSVLFAILNSQPEYTEKFSIGLITSAGYVGILFPPSLVIIVYGTIAQINIKDLFIAGLIPGALIVFGLILFSLVISLRSGVRFHPFYPKQAGACIVSASGEIIIPLLLGLVFFTGFATILQTSALAVVYIFILEVFVHREITLRNIPKIILQCMGIVGGILSILAFARGLSYYMVAQEIPQQLTQFIHSTISSRVLFLLILNVLLLVVGSFMDIFSAILIVAPLIFPMAEVYDIDRIHLAMIFLTNLGIGYITPPVGMDLFLSAYRFKKTLPQIYHSIIPFFFVQIFILLIITYVPQLSTLFVSG